LARDLGHTLSIAHSLNWGGLPHLLLRDRAACKAVVDALYPIAERNRFAWPLAYARFQRGWLLAQESDRRAGIEEMIKAVGSTPNAVMQPTVLTMIAEQQMLAGDLADAAASLDQAMTQTEARHIDFHKGDTLRVRGELLLAQSRDNVAAAEATLRQAADVAARQQCRPLQLRAATSLAWLLA
jgi:hypothetical protein